MSVPVIQNDPNKYLNQTGGQEAGMNALKDSANFKYDHLDFKNLKPIPEGFTKIGCCACNIDTNFPYCFGCKSNCAMCCCQFASLACKPIEHDKVKCILQEEIFELTTCNSFLNCYRQCFCLEVVMGIPSLDGYLPMDAVIKDGDSFAKPDPDFLLVHNGSCCCIDSCYTKWPECIGCYGSGFLCCIEQSYTGCKPLFMNPDRAEQSLLCLCRKVSCNLVDFKCQCKNEGQNFCMESRSAFPCDDDVPCVCAAYCLTCCVNWGPLCGCCLSLKSIQDHVKTTQGGAQPVANTNA